MRRKAPVQFLGEGALATAPPYPTGREDAPGASGTGLRGLPDVGHHPWHTPPAVVLDARWPGVMELTLPASGDKVRVIEDCLNGRRPVWDDRTSRAGMGWWGSSSGPTQARSPSLSQNRGGLTQFRLARGRDRH